MRHLRRWYVYGPITIAIVGLLLWRTEIWTAADLLRDADPRPLVAAVALNGVIIACWAIRSGRLLATLGRRIATRELLPIVSFANTINGLTPASAGEVLRAVILHRRHAVAYRESAALIVVERGYALGLIVVSALACVAIAAGGPLIGAGATLLAIAAAAAPTVIYRSGHRVTDVSSRVLGPLARRWRAVRHLDVQLISVEDQVAATLARPPVAVAFVAITAAIFVSMDAQLLLVGAAIGIPMDPIVGWAALGLGAVAGVLSALPFGLGAADAVIALVLVGFGTDPAAAALVTVLLRLVATLPTGLFGVASFLYLQRTEAVGLPEASTSGRETG
jgi:uncharacterized protein (TIRG00374 family)